MRAVDLLKTAGVLAGGVLAAAMALLGCTGAPTGGAQATSSPLTTGGSAEMSIVVESSSFAPGGPIPIRHTGDGADISPPLSWNALPEGTRELALIVDDPDAPRAEPWVHWVIYKIPGTEGGSAEGVGSGGGASLPTGALQGRNDFGSTGYGGPAPPRGHGTHHYRFTLYALDAPLDVGTGLDKAALLGAMRGHILGQGELVGTYER